MADLTAAAIRAAAASCAAAWGEAQLAAATRGVAAPRFDTTFARWPLLASADALAVALDATPAGASASPATSVPQLAAWLAVARVRAAAAPYAARLADARRRAVVRMPGAAAVPWREVPARLSGLGSDAATRRALGSARARVTADVLAPLARERVARSCAAVDALELAGGYDEAFTLLTGEAPAARVGLATEWLARTDAAWSDTLAERARRGLGLPVRELHAADLPVLLAAPGDAPPLGGSALAAAVRTQLAGMGVDPDARGRVRTGPIGTSAPDASIGEWHARAIAVRVPDEVYLLTPARRDADAARDYLDALGRALHLAHSDAALPFEARWQGNAGAARATGVLLSALLRDRGWLRRYAGLSGAALDAAARTAAFRELAALRLAAARTGVSAAAYGDVVPLGEVAGVFVERVTAACGVAPDPGGALVDVDPPFAVGDTLRAAVTAGTLGELLRERFDEDWWRNPRAGAWLATEWFAAPPAVGPEPGPLAAALTRALQ